MEIFLIQFVNMLGTVLYVAILGRIIVSWLNVSPQNPLVTILYQLTEPILAPIRRVLPRAGMFDFSPTVAILLIFAVQWIFIQALSG